MNANAQEERAYEGAHRSRYIAAWGMLALSLAVSAVMGTRLVRAWRHAQSSSWPTPHTTVAFHDTMVSTPSGLDVELALAFTFILLLLVVAAVIPLVIAWRGSFWLSFGLTLLMWMAWLAVLVLWPIFLDTPLEEPSNPSTTPSPSHSRFLLLKESWALASPWLLGVAVPLQGLILPMLISVVWVIYLAKAEWWRASASV